MSYVRPVLYPFLLSLYFVLLVFSENLGEAFLGQAIRSVLVLLAATGLLVLLFTKVFNSADKAAFVTASLLLFIFTVPDLEGLVPRAVSRHKVLLLAIETVGLLAIIALTLRAVKHWPIVNQALNVTAGVMLLLALYRIGSYGISAEGFIFEPTPEVMMVSTEGFQRPDGVPPNIYYLIVDAYTRADTLQDYFGYDNSEFIEFLEEKGFQVSHNSVANYHKTKLAVPSVLNFEYLADEDGFTEEHPQGVQILLAQKTFNNKVASILRQLGYRVVTVGKGKHVRIAHAEKLSLADSWLTSNEFELALLGTTLLPRFFNVPQFLWLLSAEKENVFVEMSRGWLYADRHRVDFVIQEVSRQVSGEGPMFLIAHIMAPHPPFVYDREGNVPDISQFLWGKREHFGANARAYADEVHYLNILLRNMIENILDNSETAPIIILQGDHGLRLTRAEMTPRESRSLDVRKQVEIGCMRELFTNLNALYLPDNKGHAAFYDSISPVNTFRLIFDTYFGSELGMLDDRSFFSRTNNDDNTMSFIEVTGLQETCHPLWEQRFRELR